VFNRQVGGRLLNFTRFRNFICGMLCWYCRRDKLIVMNQRALMELFRVHWASESVGTGVAKSHVSRSWPSYNVQTGVLCIAYRSKWCLSRLFYSSFVKWHIPISASVRNDSVCKSTRVWIKCFKNWICKYFVAVINLINIQTSFGYVNVRS
jgi:hypothetical protein